MTPAFSITGTPGGAPFDEISESRLGSSTELRQNR
jgi:hypothetical protein